MTFPIPLTSCCDAPVAGIDRICQSRGQVAWGSFSDAFRGICGYFWLIFFPVFLLNVMYSIYTLSGWAGKVVASHAAVARSIPVEVAVIYNTHEALRRYCPWGWGCDQSIWSTVSDAIDCSWLWLTATRSLPLGCFSTLLQLVDNWPHILC